MDDKEDKKQGTEQLSPDEKPVSKSKLVNSLVHSENNTLKEDIESFDKLANLNKYIRNSVNYERAIKLVDELGLNSNDSNKLRSIIEKDYSKHIEIYKKKFINIFNSALEKESFNKESVVSTLNKIVNDERKKILAEKKPEHSNIIKFIKSAVDQYKETELKDDSESVAEDIIAKYEDIYDKIDNLYIPDSREALNDKNIIQRIKDNIFRDAPKVDGYVERLKLRMEAMSKGISAGNSYIISERLGKTRIAAGAAVAFGGAIIGGKDIVQALKGNESDEKGEDDGNPNLGRFVLGAIKLTGAMAIASRLATGKVGTIFGR